MILTGIFSVNHSVEVIEKKYFSGFYHAEFTLPAKTTSLIHISPLVNGDSPEELILNISISKLDISESFYLIYLVSGTGGGFYQNLDSDSSYSHFYFQNPSSQSLAYNISIQPDTLDDYKVIILYNSLKDGVSIFYQLLISITSFSIHLSIITCLIESSERDKLLSLFKKKWGKYHLILYSLLTSFFLCFSLFNLLINCFIYI